jgi:uncharacterized protein (DUF4415 family)
MPKLKPGTIHPTDEEDAAITKAAMEDPDTFHPTEENLKEFYRKAVRGRPLGSGNKSKLTVRLDDEIISSFKESGSGWQTRMNDALKDWLKHHKPSELR